MEAKPKGILYSKPVVVFAAGVGTMIDYYDFLLAANAAGTVWQALYFEPALKVPGVALAVAILTYALSYIVRPLGAFIFGHLGDRYGRQSTLVLTLLLAFVAMVGMGAMPTYSQIGIASVALLMLLRIVLGISFGGEWGGAATWMSEFLMRDDPGKLGLWGGVLQSFATAGIALSSLAFSLTSLLMPTTAFSTWGWRILFYIGAVVVVVGAIIRYRLTESPVFTELMRGGRILRYPAARVLRERWSGVLLLALAWLYIAAVTVVAVLPYSIVYVTKVVGVRTIAGLPAASFIQLTYALALLTGGIASTMLSGILADKVNPSTIIIAGAAATAIMSVVFYPLLSTGKIPMIVAAFEAYMLSEYFGFGALPSWFTKSFKAEYRYSGSGMAYQFGGFFTGIASGVILASIVAVAGYSSWYLVSALMVAISMASILAALALRGVGDAGAGA